MILYCYRKGGVEMREDDRLIYINTMLLHGEDGSTPREIRDGKLDKNSQEYKVLSRYRSRCPHTTLKIISNKDAMYLCVRNSCDDCVVKAFELFKIKMGGDFNVKHE